MDNFRLVLFFALAFVLLLIYQAWMKDYGGTQPTTAQQPSTAPTSYPGPGTGPDAREVPTAPATSAPSPATPQPGVAPTHQDLVRVRTDLLDVAISTRGGTLDSVWLVDYPASPKEPDSKFRLFKPNAPNMFVAQSGLLGPSKDLAPTHESRFEAKEKSYTLAAGQDQLSVDLIWTHPSGLKVTKRYLFQRGRYEIEVIHEVSNTSGKDWIGRQYAQLQRTDFHDPNEPRFVHTYTGAAYYSPEDKYEKYSFGDIEEKSLDRDIKDGWIAMLQHYFVAAWIPPTGDAVHFYSRSLPGARYLIGMYSPGRTVSAGSTLSFSSRLYAGPKLQDQLATVAPGLELTVDYGWLTVLAQPIFWLLEKLHGLVGNWGWAIILLTILIKLAFYKLSETSYKSMAHMRKMTPRMQALKDRYGDDRQRLNQAMMEMYKKEKVNPLGGCLPIVVQIPVFIALYWVLLESVELRQAPFILWIDNLSAPDPYYVLPLIMGISMFVQQKLNPAPVDPLQAKIMMSLPIVFTIFFAFFPSGLVVYWVVNNLLSISQQWYITRKIEQSAKPT